MTLTSAFLVLVMIMIWKTHILLVIAYVVFIGGVELLYLSSVLYKFDQGGYLPLAFAAVMVIIMYVWHSVYRRKYYYELNNKISPKKLKEIMANTNICRMQGLAFFYSELVQGIPPIFKHYVANVPALHSVLVFVSVKSLHISKVPPEERFLFRRVDPTKLHVFRCVVRYGYKDARNEQEPFETILVGRLKEFIREEPSLIGEEVEGEREWKREEEIEREVDLLEKAWEAGVVHLMGESEVVASKGSSLGKRVLLNYAYNFLRRNLRQSEEVFDIPHKRLLKVGMTYEL